MTSLQNRRIETISPLLPPNWVAQQPLSQPLITHVLQRRGEAEAIINQLDQRLLVVVGPCSIHDKTAALDYAKRLAKLQYDFDDALCIMMRVYFEKPRTTTGWKGFINDPHLDCSYDINHGLSEARDLLIKINALGLGVATEFLDSITPQYISDLVSWAAIGARTTESQIHRNLASGLSMPVGFKNSTTGNINVAIDALIAASHPHSFLSVTEHGNAAIVRTKGNPDTHVILRGGSDHGPNYQQEVVASVSRLLTEKTLNTSIMIDCSHANSNKDHRQQTNVVSDVCQQISHGSQSIIGIMLESNLVAGKQTLTDPQQLQYGLSITDACIAWDETSGILQQLAQCVREYRPINNTIRSSI